MTRDGELILLREHLAICDRLSQRLVRVRQRIEALMPMTMDRLLSLEADDEIDVLAFLKTYEQFEDTLGRTMKTIAMVVQFGKVEHLTPRDVANRAVALGILEDGKRWSDAVRVRNELAHQYPLKPHKQAAQVNAAWDSSSALFETCEAITTFVERERLLYGDL